MSMYRSRTRRKTQPGIEAQLRFNEHPGKDFPAKLVRTARALDPTLRTLRVELQVDNSNGELFPGAYAEAHFKIPGSATTYRVPATALIFRSKGLQIATVGADNKAHLHSRQSRVATSAPPSRCLQV